MANSIELAKKYAPLLDEVFKNASVSGVLDSPAEMAREGANVNEICVPKLDMNGLADYSRSSGYVDGDETMTWQTVRFNYERGRMFTVDAMDNEESQNLAFGRLASEFIRTKAAPELDAFRFAEYASAADIGTETVNLGTGAQVIASLRGAVSEMDEAEVPADGRYLFITPTLRGMVEDMDTYKSKAIMAGFSQIITVPQTRFYSSIKLNSGTGGEAAGGYVKASDVYELLTAEPADWDTAYTSYYTKSGSTYTANSDSTWASDTFYKKTANAGKNLNYMIIYKGAVIQFLKHIAPKIITPDMNQHADAWKYGYRVYGLADTYENKRAGIFASIAST